MVFLSIFIFSVDWRIPQEAWDPPPIVLIELLFVILVAWKWDSSKVVRPSTHRHLAFTKPLFGLLEAWQWESSRLMRLWAEEYKASNVQLFVPLGGLIKAIPAMSLIPPIQANWLHVNHCSTFRLLENVILLRFMKPSDQWYLAFIEIQLSIMATWKKDSLRVLGPSAQGYVANFQRINGIFVA
jgi:hypothetical protein